MRSRGVPSSMPTASNSARFHPPPMPSSARPPEMRSIVAIACAHSTGWRIGADSIVVVRSTRSVAPAAAASPAMPWETARCGSGAIPLKKWSMTRTPS